MRFAGSPQVASFMADSVNHGELGRIGSRSRAKDQMQAFDSDAKVGMAQNDADTMLKLAEMGAAQQRQAGQQAGQNSLMSGIMGGVSSIAGGLFGGGGGGATMGGSGYYDPMTGKGTAGPNFGL